MTAQASLVKSLVIRASAGTGKTFQLARRYLSLIDRGQPPERILATTFARKAAGEILARVLGDLARAALDTEQRTRLSEELGGGPRTAARLRALLRQLVDRLHRLRIGTLDSFFVEIAGSYGLELGLPLGWRIVEPQDDAVLRQRAIQEMLRDAPGESAQLMQLLSKGEVRRGVAEQLTELVGELYALYRETDGAAEVWQQFPQAPDPPQAEVDAALARLEALTGPEGEPWTQAHTTALEAMQTEDWKTLFSQGISGKVAANEAKYNRKPIPPDIAALYATLLKRALHRFAARLAQQTEATHGLLDRFHRVYDELKRQARAFRFDDVSYALARELGSEHLDPLAFRLDAHVEHLLLDEFQDTSPVQWRILRPFAEATARDAGRTFFCVGDVKQAIYGWRGGAAELFEQVDAQLPDVTVQSLAKSYRSSPIIMHAVNRVFGSLAGNPALAEHPKVSAAWRQRFETHTTDHTDLPGHFRAVVGPAPPPGTKVREAVLAFAARETARLAEEHPGRTIGVLVRKNETVARLIYLLREQHGIAASEEGGNPLVDSAAVRLVLAWLHLADHPGDGTARFLVAHSPLAEVVGLTDYKNDRQAAELAARLRAELLAQGYGAVVRRLSVALAPACDARDLSRLEQLVIRAQAYDASATLRTSDFVTRVREERVEDPTSAPVRVMTIHQSKGLEFDIVVLPELGARPIGQPPRVVIDRPSPFAPVRRILRYVGQDERALLPGDVGDVCDRDADDRINESLCLLYVALTRAVHALHVILPPSHDGPTVEGQPRPKGLRFEKKSMAGVIRGALCEDPEAMLLPNMVLDEQGNPNWSRHAPPPRHAAAATDGARDAGPPQARDADRPLVAPSGAARRRGLDRRTPSSLEGGREFDLRQVVRVDNPTALARGSLIHEWFARVGWLDEALPTDDELRPLGAQHGVPPTEVERYLAEFRAMLERPAVEDQLRRASFTAPAGAALPESVRRLKSAGPLTVELWRERPFAIRDGDALLEGILDRAVVLRDAAGHAVGAVVLDFKTDDVADAPAALVRAEHYRPQLAAYARAVARLVGLGRGQIEARLLFVGPGVVVPVES